MRYSRMEQQRPEEMRTREGGRSGVAFLLAVLAIAAAIYFWAIRCLLRCFPLSPICAGAMRTGMQKGLLGRNPPRA